MSRQAAQAELDWAADLETLTSAVSAGLSEVQALNLVASRSSRTWSSVFNQLAHDAEHHGLEIATANVKSAAADCKVDLLCEILLASNRFGSPNLHKLLQNQASRYRHSAAVHQGAIEKIRAVLMVARIASAAPWLLLVMLCSRSENQSAFLSANGLAVLVGGAALTAAAMAIMLKIARIPKPQRVLTE